MKVYLLRHGEADNKTPDSKRELTDHGITQINSVAKKAKGKSISPIQIFHSGYTRAKQSAELFLEIINKDLSADQKANLTPNDDPELWVDELNKCDKDTLLVGHNPFMSKLSMYLAGPENYVEFGTANMVCLEKDGDSWTILWHLTP